MKLDTTLLIKQKFINLEILWHLQHTQFFIRKYMCVCVCVSTKLVMTLLL